MEIVTTCPACGQTQFTPLYICADHLLTGETFRIAICDHCTLGITSPRPDAKAISRYYESNQYHSHSTTQRSLLTWLYRHARNWQSRQKVKLLRPLQPNGRVLDFGCGAGHFLRAAQAASYQVVGYEPNPAARTAAATLLQQPVHADVAPLAGQRYHLITLWHVLEHVHDLNATIDLLKGLLLPDGHLVLAMPNYLSQDASHYQQHWAAFDVPRHVWHFTPMAAHTLLTKHGMHITNTRPMLLDSFYVSLQSERYRSGHARADQYLKAFGIGLASNRSARQTGHYSSLIYIARHA